MAAYLCVGLAQVREVTVTSCGAAVDERARIHADVPGYAPPPLLTTSCVIARLTAEQQEHEQDDDMTTTKRPAEGKHRPAGQARRP
jgi:hypothetical protein